MSFVIPANTLDELYARATSPADYARSYVAHFTRVAEGLDANVLERIIECLQQAWRDRRTVFIAGNGGSAAVANHFVCDLGKGTRTEGVPAFRAITLSDNVALLTAQANDEGFQTIFSSQLDGLCEKDDVVILISSSGNSPNVVEAARVAKVRGATVVGFVGFAGGTLAELSDIVLHVKTRAGEYGPVEDSHSVAMHVIVTHLRLWLMDQAKG